MKKLIIFDFDGVIVDTEKKYFLINKSVNEEETPETYRDLFMGNIHEELVKRKEKGIKTFSVEEFVERQRDCFEEIEMFEGMYEVISKLYSDGNILSIVSSNEGLFIKKLLHKFNLDHYFSDILGSDIQKSKVKKINTLLDKYGIEKENTKMITDTLGDILEAKSVGIEAIGVDRGFHDIGRLEKGEPMVVVSAPNEIIDHI